MMRLALTTFAAWLVLAGATPAGHAQGQAVVAGDRVNVRSRPSLSGEVVTQLARGQRVLVFEEGLPALLPKDPVTEWTRIELPAGTRVWVAAGHVDPASNQVLPRLLNVRAGPSEDYGVLGTVARGTTLTVQGSAGGWLEIAAPPGLSGFVAAHLLKPVENATPAAPDTAPPPAAPAPATKDASAPDLPARPDTQAPDPPPATEPAAQPTPSPPAQAEPAEPSSTPGQPRSDDRSHDERRSPEAAPTPGPRIVQREGIVRGTLSIQAPTAFELRATDTGRRLNYLLPASTNNDLRPFRGERVRVAGEEYIEERWATPLLRVDEIILAP
jgi:uncharacterized protein YraI